MNVAAYAPPGGGFGGGGGGFTTMSGGERITQPWDGRLAGLHPAPMGGLGAISEAGEEEHHLHKTALSEPRYAEPVVRGATREEQLARMLEWERERAKEARSRPISPDLARPSRPPQPPPRSARSPPDLARPSSSGSASASSSASARPRGSATTSGCSSGRGSGSSA